MCCERLVVVNSDGRVDDDATNKEVGLLVVKYDDGIQCMLFLLLCSSNRSWSVAESAARLLG